MPKSRSIYAWSKPVDLRCAIDGLRVLVKTLMREDMLGGAVFVYAFGK